MGPGSISDPETWVDQHGDYLFRCALLRVRNHTVAEELVQETFLAGLQAKDRFAGLSSERSWLVGILKHKVVDYFRKSSREQVEPESDFKDGEGHQFFDELGQWKHEAGGPKAWNDPSTAVEQKQFWTVMKSCLEELPGRTAKVFSLREIDDLPSDEICDTLNITKANLWVMLHRARNQLRQCLEVKYMGLKE